MPSILSGCCLQKARTRDPLRFLLDPCIDYPPFAKTRRFAAQTIARWRKLAQISLRKPRDGHGVSVFCYPASEKSSQAFHLHAGRKQETTVNPNRLAVNC